MSCYTAKSVTKVIWIFFFQNSDVTTNCSITTTGKLYPSVHWARGLVVWFSLRVRAVLGSIPSLPLYFCHHWSFYLMWGKSLGIGCWFYDKHLMWLTKHLEITEGDLGGVYFFLAYIHVYHRAGKMMANGKPYLFFSTFVTVKSS